MADELDEAMHTAIADVLTVHDPGVMVTRWIALIEVLDPDGDRSLWSSTSPDLKGWEALGLLEHARMVEQAALVEDDQ